MDGRAIVSGRRSSLANAPVAPGRLPLVGHAVQLARHPLEFMDGLREHGKVVRIQLGPVPAYVVTDADLTVSTRKSCEGHADGRRGRVATPGVGVFVRGSVGLRWWRLCPGAEVFGVGVPGQETFEAGA